MPSKCKALAEADGNVRPLKQAKLSFAASAQAPQSSGEPAHDTPTLPITTSPPPPTPNQLLVMKASREACAGFVSLIHGDSQGSAMTNQSLPPIVHPLTDADLRFPQELPHGHCKALYTCTMKNGILEEKLKLLEGGQNNDSPRTSLLAGVKSKVYIYHILAAHHAYTSPTSRLSIPRLQEVSQDKRSVKPLTILHLCGHKWCMNAEHMAVGSKIWNEEQTACHRGLQVTENELELDMVGKAYCRHIEKCWTIVYKGPFADNRIGFQKQTSSATFVRCTWADDASNGGNSTSLEPLCASRKNDRHLGACYNGDFSHLLRGQQENSSTLSPSQVTSPDHPYQGAEPD